jgi:LysM repeat protein
VFDLTTDVRSKTGLTGSQLEALVVDTGLAGTGGSFASGENLRNINALFAMAHAAIESSWGRSHLAQDRNNLFGINAVDTNPNLAFPYPSKGACIDFYFDFLDKKYLTPGGTFYSGGTTIHHIFVRYSSSHDEEGTSVANIMNELARKLQLGLPVITVSPSGGATYVVQSGDTMSAIAAAHGLTLARLEQLNPNAGHPSGNFNNIAPGDPIRLVGAAPDGAPSNSPRFYKVVPGDTLSAIAASNGLGLAEIETMNPSAGHPAGNFSILWPGDQVRIE